MAKKWDITESPAFTADAYGLLGDTNRKHIDQSVAGEIACPQKAQVWVKEPGLNGVYTLVVDLSKPVINQQRKCKLCQVVYCVAAEHHTILYVRLFCPPAQGQPNRKTLKKLRDYYKKWRVFLSRNDA